MDDVGGNVDPDAIAAQCPECTVITHDRTSVLATRIRLRCGICGHEYWMVRALDGPWRRAFSLRTWWSEPEYLACSTGRDRGRFLLDKLLQHDPVGLRGVMTTWEVDQKESDDIGRFEWVTILRTLGVVPDEIAGVLERMGRQWPDEADQRAYARMDEILGRPNVHPADWANVMASVMGWVQLYRNEPLPPAGTAAVTSWLGIIRHSVTDPSFLGTVEGLQCAYGTFGAWVKQVVRDHVRAKETRPSRNV